MKIDLSSTAASLEFEEREKEAGWKIDCVARIHATNLANIDFAEIYHDELARC